MKGLKDEKGDFEFGEENIAEKLAELECQYLEVNEDIPKMVKQVVKLEDTSYGRRDIDERTLNGPYSLQFLVEDEELHCYKDEIVRIMDDDADLQLSNQLKDLGLVHLIGGDNKNGLQSVIQILLEIQTMKTYYLKESYPHIGPLVMT